MTIDAALLREAKDVLSLYGSPVQELLKENLYGPREARFAGAIVKNALVVVAHEQATETEALKTLKIQAWEQIEMLIKLLGQTTAIIEEHVAIDVATRELLQECETQAVTAEENFFVEVNEETPL